MDADREMVDEALDAITEAIMCAWGTYGWKQSGYGNDESGYCLIGAWQRATGLSDRDWLTKDFRAAVNDSIGMLFPLHDRSGWSGMTAENFNDHPDRSEEDVRLVVKHAMESLRDVVAERVLAAAG
jgi:hypothetical protein